MKSSRSASSQNTRRNARRIISESSDDSDNDIPLSKSSQNTRKHAHRIISELSNDSDRDNSLMDSARAEKLFSRRRHQKYTSNMDTSNDESHCIQAEKTLFRVSDTSDSESSLGISNVSKQKSRNKKESLKIQNDLSIDESIFKPSKNDMYKYRNILQSSDDEQSKSNLNSMLNDTPVSEKSSSINSGDDGIVEEFTDEPVNCIANESFFITPNRLKNKPIIKSDSSNESEVVGRTVKKWIANESSIIFESESDDDIVNSSNEIFPTPLKVNRKKYEIETKLKDLSLIQPSDSDNDTSAHYKSTIVSSNQNRPFIDDIKYSDTTHPLSEPISQSSILENCNFDVPLEVSNNQKIKKNIDVITLDDDYQTTPKVFSLKHNPIIIDLTGDTHDKKSSILSKTNILENSEKLSIDKYKSLKMEKERLEEIMQRFTKNIDNMKQTFMVTNLHKLPDGGLKLKKAILKEESAFKDIVLQFNNVDHKLKQFPDSFRNQIEIRTSLSPPPSFNPPNCALIKKAAANIDIGAMGQKALSTYHSQQTMTLDILHHLHKSLETCPAPTILADDPSGLKVELMLHQKYAIAWLMWRENQKPHGGILADDMGLGKTLTMISLVLKASEAEKNRIYSDTDSDLDNSSENSKFNNIKGGTLIICPSSLISQWQNEVKNKLRPRMLDVVQHYGQKRESSARRLARKDIVITTYHVVMWDHKSHQNTSPLFQIKWKRIILDEAHTIRNFKSHTSIAVSALSGVNRWALSGTPIHNKESDFYALLKFIKCHPFDDWATWKRWVGNNDEAGKNRLALLVKALMLRRTKTELSEATSFKLPSKTFHNIKVELFKEEKDAYEKILHFSSKLFATYLYEKAEKENAIDRGFPVHNKVKYLHQTNMEENIFQDHPELDKLFKQLKNNKNIQAHHILVLLLRLRQLCCHPCLMKNMLEDESLKVDGIQNTGDLDLVDHMSRMSIGVPSVEKQTLVKSNPIFKDSWISSKIKAVCDMVNEKVLHTDDKAIIVSQWPSMLNLIAKQLSQYKIKTEMFSGAVPIIQRNKIVDEFNSLKGGAKILLLSLTAGGVGLNLVAANHLFMVDIHWNPQLEAQACDRIYRVGQTKPVNVYKFICDNTIETSIQTIQNNKLAIANNLFGGCRNVEGTKITLDDLKEIFNINPKKKY